MTPDQTLQQLAATVDSHRLALKAARTRRGFVAHRGLQSVAPENSLRSIHEAGRRGYAMCEIDTQLTMDGHWIMMHDPLVDRTTDGTGPVAEMTLADIRRLRIDTPKQQIDEDEIIRVPMFEDVLRECSLFGMGVMIDGQKYAVNAENIRSLTGLLKKYGVFDKSGFYMPKLPDRIAGSEFPEITMLHTVTSATIDEALDEVSRYDNYMLLAFKSSDLTEAVAERVLDAGHGLYVWNAHVLKEALRWLKFGAQYIETNFILPGGVF
jgi:glycerophosphoryl diester phosphodiesterase